ncbi:hypothetical protein HMPREF0345_0454, partial [Enterococcus faecalis ATCC 29200]
KVESLGFLDAIDEPGCRVQPLQCGVIQQMFVSVFPIEQGDVLCHGAVQVDRGARNPPSACRVAITCNKSWARP